MKIKFLIYFFFLISFIACTKTWHISSQKVAYHRFDTRSRIANDPETEAMIAPYRSKMSGEMNKIIGYSDMELTKRQPESTLGNWFADIVKKEAERLYGKKVDGAIQNYGGLRISSIAPGDLTTGKIFELMPFENMLLILEMDGKVLNQLLDRIAYYGGWPISRGISFVIKDKTAHNILIDNKPIDHKSKYTIALPDYIANGGDRCDFLIDQKRTDLNMLIRDIVIEHLEVNYKNGVVIHSEIEGRIKY